MEEHTRFNFSEWVRNYDTVFLLKPAFYSASVVALNMLKAQRNEGVQMRLLANGEELGRIASLLGNATVQSLSRYSIGYDPNAQIFKDFIASESIAVVYDDSKIHGALLNAFQWTPKTNGKYNRTMVVLVDNFFPKSKFDAIKAKTRSGRGNTASPLIYSMASIPVKLNTSIVKVPVSDEIYTAYTARRSLEVGRRTGSGDNANLARYKWSSRISNYLYPQEIKAQWDHINPQVSLIKRDLPVEQGGWITSQYASSLKKHGTKIYQVIVDCMKTYKDKVKVIWMSSPTEGGVQLMTTMYNMYADSTNNKRAVSMLDTNTDQQKKEIIAHINSGSSNALICNASATSDFIGLKNVGMLAVVDPIKYSDFRNLIKGVYRFENYAGSPVNSLALKFYVTRRKSNTADKLGDYLAQSSTFNEIEASFDTYNALSGDSNTMSLKTETITGGDSRFFIIDDRANQ